MSDILPAQTACANMSSIGRWARGEMQGAVEKRKNTLAKKAEAKATAPPPDLTPKPLKPAATPFDHPAYRNRVKSVEPNPHAPFIFHQPHIPPPQGPLM